MKDNNVIQFPMEQNRLQMWTKYFIHYYLDRGPTYATKYLNEKVPKQFYRQIKILAQRELLKRGITN